MAHFENNLIAGLGPQPADMQAQGVPPFWASNIKHDNVDAVAAKVAEAGGTVLMPPMDIMDSGRMLMAVDPTGANFGVWQPNQHIGAWHVGFSPQWITREYLARRGKSTFERSKLMEARCPLLGLHPEKIQVEGQTVGSWFFDVSSQLRFIDRPTLWEATSAMTFISPAKRGWGASPVLRSCGRKAAVTYQRRPSDS